MLRIATATKSTDLFGAGKHGFTDGNAQGGTPPTQFSALWCNAVQEAIAQTVEGSGLTLDGDDHTQLHKAVAIIARTWTPDIIGVSGVARTWRSHSFGGAEPDTWLTHEYMGEHINVASGGTLRGTFTVPDEHFFVGTVQAAVVRTDATLVAGYFVAFRGWCTGGAANLAGADEIYGNTGTLAIDSVSMDAASDVVRLNIALNAAPAAKEYNLQTTWRLTMVTKYDQP